MRTDPTGSAARLVRDVLLSDGSTLRLRAPTPEDFDDIKGFYEGLSQESRYLRFHGYGRTDVAAQAYAESNGVDRVALIGRHGERIVAAAGYDLLREPDAAEVAFTVTDGFQRRGTATRMLEQLAAIAAERGIRRFDAYVMAGNRGMLRVFEGAGFELRREGSAGEVTVSLDITPTEAVKERIEERDHLASVAALKPILTPASVAVVSDFNSPDEHGRAVLAKIIAGGFIGVARSVEFGAVAEGSDGQAGGGAGPGQEGGVIVCSMRAVGTLAELDEVPELVIVAVSGQRVLDTAAQAADLGVKALLVLSAELAADPTQERSAEDRLLQVVRSSGLRMVGTGSLGVLNTDPSVSLNATFAGPNVVSGRLAVCSQSGAIGIGLLGHAAARELGISTFVSLGSRVDVSTNDLLELWEEDGRTAAVMLYVETFGNPERFTRIAKRVSRRKPILAVKGRRATDRARGEASSHTAAALRGDAVADALLRQAGVLRFRNGEDLFNSAEFFERQPLPGGRRVGVVTNSDGVATLAVDACLTRGLVLSEGRNPVVLGIQAGPTEYEAAIRALLADPGVDAVMVYYVDLSGGEPELVLAATTAAFESQVKPVVASVLHADGRLPKCSPPSVPNFLFPEACPSVLARAAERREWLSRPLGQRSAFADVDVDGARALIEARLGAGQGGWLDLEDAEALLTAFRIPVLASRRCSDVETAVRAAGELGRLIALKADFAPPAHAGDVDAVLLGLEGEEAVRAGWRELERRVRSAGRAWIGAVVQPLAPPGADLLVGAVTDVDFGPVTAVGLGGRQAGLGDSAAFRLLPTMDVEADELIDASTAVVAHLEGFRGSERLDRAALHELVLRFAALLSALPEVAEADLNPVRCIAVGCLVLDLRLRIERRSRPDRVKTW